MLDSRIDVEQFFKHHPIGEAGRFALLAEHRDTRFVPVATHQQGELNCASRRITRVLDLKASYQRLKAWRSWVYLTARWPASLHHRFAA